MSTVNVKNQLDPALRPVLTAFELPAVDAEGVLYVGRGQEKATVWRTQRRYHADGSSYAWLVKTSARGRGPVGTLASTARVRVSTAVTSASTSEVTNTTLPSGRTVTPSGSRPTGTLPRIAPVVALSTLGSRATAWAVSSRTAW